MIFVLFGISFTMGGFTIYFAINASDPGVEPNYYEKALDWDTTAAQLQLNKDLGWSLTSASVTHETGRTIVIDIADDQARPLQIAAVSAHVFANTHASERLDVLFVETDPGRYESVVPITHAGNWTIRVRAEARGEVFTHEGEIPEPDSAP